MIPKIGLSVEGLDKSINLLAIVLSDEMTLYIKTRKFHWNVAGQSFMELHKLFEAQYSELEQLIDTVAERISKLGGKTIGTMHEFSLLTRIVEHPNKYPVQNVMLTELLNDHKTIIYELRKDIDICNNECHDAGTADLLTGILQQHETITWILGRYLS